MAIHRAHAPSRSPSARFFDLLEQALVRYHALERASRWGVLAALALGGFYLLDGVLWKIADDMNQRSDRLEAVLQRAADRAEGLPDEVVQSALALGPVAVPKTESAGKEKLAAAIAEAFKKRSINPGQHVRSAQSLPPNILPTIAGPLGGSMGKSVAEVRFEGSPDAVLGVLAELDSSDSIDAISDLKLNYSPLTKRVTVIMSLEKWGVTRKTSRGGA